MLEGNKVIVTVDINGGMQQDRDGAIVPKQPVEIGEAAARCYEAGASVIHFHARDAEGRNSGAREIYAEAIRQIRARSPILIQTTNGIGVRRDPATGQFIWPSDSERLGLLEIEPQQDLFGIAGGSADFYNPEGGYPAETPYVNSPELLKKTITAVYQLSNAKSWRPVRCTASAATRKKAFSTVIATTFGSCTEAGSAPLLRSHEMCRSISMRGCAFSRTQSGE
jgi:3-keto-5-aminohexanoate cleavage enzyme